MHADAVLGIDPFPLAIEAGNRSGTNKMVVAGLTRIAVKESLERIRSGLGNSGFCPPGSVVVVNLSSARVRK